MVKKKRHQRNTDHRRRLRQELAFPQVLDAMPDPVLITTAEGRICYVNPAWERQTGYFLSEIRGKNPRLLNSGKTPARVYAMVWEELAAGRPFFTDEIVDRRKDGSKYQIRATFFPIRRNGKNVFFVQIQHDITRHAARVRQMEENAHLYRTLIDDASDGILLLDIEARIVGANKAICAMLGYAPEEIIGQNIAAIGDPEDATPYAIRTAELLEKRSLLTERIFRRKDGRKIPVELHNKLIDARLIQSIVRDMTRKKELEKQRDAFIGMVAHEIRTPLLVLRNNAELINIVRNQDESVPLKPLAETLIEQVSRLSILVDDLLNLNRLQTGEMPLTKEPVEPASFLRQIAADMGTISGLHEIRLVGEADGIMMVDRARLRQVIENLLTNAIKYSPGQDHVDLTFARHDGEIVFSVRDYGIGIEPEEQKKIFRLFYRTESEDTRLLPGYGFGLYIAAQIVQKHGGRIWVESKKGKGSTFFVALPLAKGETGEERA